MNRNEFNKICDSFSKNEERLKSLKAGDLIYEQDSQDPIEFSYFKHEVLSVDLDEMCVNTLDYSLDKKPTKLYSFYKEEEIK